MKLQYPLIAGLCLLNSLAVGQSCPNALTVSSDVNVNSGAYRIDCTPILQIQASSSVCLGPATGINTTGTQNTFIGGFAGNANTAGTDNTYLGYKAGNSNVNGIGNVYLGHKAGFSASGSNQLIIANSAGTPLIQGDFAAGRVGIGLASPQYNLDVNGDARISDLLNVGNNLNVAGNIYSGGTMYCSQNATVAGNQLVSGDLTVNNAVLVNSYVSHLGDLDTQFGFPASNEFQINTNGTTRLKVTSNGYVGVGTTAPNYPLDVNGSLGINQRIYNRNYSGSNINIAASVMEFDVSGQEMIELFQGSSFDRIKLDAGLAKIEIKDYSNGQPDEIVLTDGNVALEVGGHASYNRFLFDVGAPTDIEVVAYNSSDPGILPVTNGRGYLGSTAKCWREAHMGDIYLNANPHVSSDARYKERIESVTDAMSLIKELRPTTYFFRSEAFGPHTMENPAYRGMQYGFIAQEVLPVAPELVHHDKEIDRYSLQYTELIPILTQAIKEQQAQIEDLQHQLAAQEVDILSRLQDLEDLNTAKASVE